MATVNNLLRRLRFRHLEMLQALNATGGIRRAAEQLNLTQPAVSKALGEIESAFGFALFERSSRGLQPTPQGEVVLRGATLLVNETMQLHDEARAAGATAETTLRVGVAPLFAATLVPAILLEMRKHGPVRATIEEGAMTPQVDKMLRGNLDALITFYAAGVSGAGDATLLVAEQLFIDRLVVIAPSDHPLVKRRRLRWSDLADEAWVLPGPSAITRQLVDSAFLNVGMTTPTPRVETQGGPTTVHFVAARLGIGAVPETAAREAHRAGRIRTLAVEPVVEMPPVALVHHRIATTQPRIVRLREAIAAVLRVRQAHGERGHLR